MKSALISACLLLFICYGTFAQIEIIKKITQSLDITEDSTALINKYNRLAMLYYEQNIDSTFYYATKARALSSQLEYIKGKADATNNLGIVFDIKGNTQLALRYYNDAYNQYTVINDSANIVQTLMNIAGVYTVNGKKVKAIQNFNKAISIGRSISKDSIMSLVITNYVLLYSDGLQKDSIDKLIKEASDIAGKYNDTRVLLAIQQLKADRYLANGQREKGIVLLERALSAALKNELFFLSIDMLIDLGDNFIKTDETKALGYYKQALSISEQKNYHTYSKAICNILYEFYVKKKDDSSAYFYSRKLVQIYINQETIDRASGIDYIEYAFKDQQLESIQLKSAYHYKLLWLSLALCVLALAIIFVLWRYWKKSQKTNELLKVQFRQLESTSQALEVSNQNYTRVIKVVAHDLRNPIGAIYTMSLLLLEEKIQNDEAMELLPLIQQSSKGCLQLIGDLLEADFNVRSENLNKEELQLSSILEQTIKLLNFRAKEKKQRLVLNDEVNAFVLVDPDKIGRVFGNLLVNSIKFSPENSEITITIEKSKEGVLIIFKDQGIGIPEEFSSKLFDPFTSAKRHGTKGEPPFGLGLYICKQIVEAHNGQIWFKSTPGEGTSFYLLLTDVATIGNHLSTALS